MTRVPAEAIVIGASAGAVDALSVVLPALPSSYSLPLMIVVHLPPDKNSVLAALLARKCNIRVLEAEDKEPVERGTAYFAPPDYHLLVEQDRTLSLSNDEPVMYSRPSVDALFESAADVYGGALVAVILSGANNDGAEGARVIAEAGGTVIIQSPAAAYASAMPEAALACCPQAMVMTLEEIALHLVALGNS